MTNTADITPFRQGQTFPYAHWTFKDTNGNNIPMPVGTVFTLYIYNPSTNITTSGQGTWVPTNLSLGQADYQWNSADSATPGQYQIYAGFVMPGGAGTGFTLPADWQVTPIYYQT